MIKIMILTLTLALASCSMNPVSMVTDLFKPKGGTEINTEVVAGDKQEEINTQVGDDIIADTVNNIQNAPIELIILACLGWFLPTPAGMVRGIQNMRKKT